MIHKNVAVLGCGYIGSKAALTWRNRGLHVTATTRHTNKLKQLADVAQKGLLIKGNDESELSSILTTNDTILVSIGADHADEYDTAYRQTAQMIRNIAGEMDSPRNLIYTSSASVYGDHQGRFVDEESDLLASTEPGKILIETERLFHSLSELGWRICILRLAEIYGPGRELSKRVMQNQHVSLAGTGQQYTNMVHRDDCAAAIDYALKHQLEGTFNLADDDHPTRKELYEAVANAHQLKIPTWDPNLTSMHSGNKRVSNHKIKTEGFTFQHPHRVLD